MEGGGGGGDEISPDRIPSLLTYINRKAAPNTGDGGVME